MRRPVTLIVVAALVLGCGGPILANPRAPRPSVPPPSTAPTSPADPVPVVLPRDDGPHDPLTEWWYYTGHLQSEAPGEARSFGFEYVIFRAERGAFPTSWASHLAITDESGGAFQYAQRQEVGPRVDRSPLDDDGSPVGFDLRLTGMDPTDPATFDRLPWSRFHTRMVIGLLIGIKAEGESLETLTKPLTATKEPAPLAAPGPAG